jgi:hypothetical protein
MTDDRLTEPAMTESLDARSLLAASRGPGHYALRLAVPDDADGAAERWDGAHDARPPEGTLDRLAAADTVAYVGAARDVYARLCDHATGAVRQPAITDAYPPTRVLDVWPVDGDPFSGEWDRARRFARGEGNVAWVNGEVLG